MFTGIDEVDWASMRHAYGSAEDVPGLLRGLASAERAEREIALDGMYGAVHHQGDVYDSTLACIPFLLTLIAREEVPDRDGIVELLVSIGGAGDGPGASAGGEARRSGTGRQRGETAGGDGSGGGGLGGDGSGEDRPGGGDRNGGGVGGYGSGGSGADRAGAGWSRGNRAMARAAVRAGAEVFVGLTGDADPGVRRAAPAALVRFLEEPARVLDLLRQRTMVERDDRVLLALAESLGVFARRHPGHAAEAIDLLVAQSGPPYGPGLRLAALGQLAGCAPDRLPADLVPTVVRLLRDRSGQRSGGRCEPGHPDTDSLVGRLRRLRPSDEEGSQLLRTLHSALGGRVAERIALLCGQLTSPDPTDRCNAVWMSAGLFREWRADPTEPVVLIGAQLGTEEGRLRDASVSVLADLFHLAAPAAGDLHALVTSRPDLWVRRWERGAPTLGGPVKALARAGDPRAVPVLAEMLADPAAPDDLGQVVPHLGQAAAPLAPALRHRLAGLRLDAPDTHRRAVTLLLALRALEDRESVPAVLRLLLGTPEDLRMRDSVMASAVRTLGTFGHAAREAIPVLRGLLEGEYAVAAAEAVWTIEGDAEAVVPALLRALADEGGHQRGRAAEVLARLGPSARPALPGLRGLAGSGSVSERTAAACALWRIGQDPDPAIPVLRSAWAEHPQTRGSIAACVATMGPAGAPLHDLLRSELAAARRHQADSGGYGSHDIHEDERLLRDCRRAVADE
ncbi:HEAT repeat domain-containing protein [Streptomyces sp. S.PNR 29]|uniref:HEAT repeat domain-containing protein n=1 Tax=Streptomyces sp. S.PNR 29 TaxID=2973805 RepID=UPI0025B0BDB8|nr:HEAT repeat domain-containing protein [Streptomyces sp. S.PNR 29]MDN0196510.1 HEAT repeat domain-containing protein [Streptomyces sp. S.PNR 29]